MRNQCSSDLDNLMEMNLERTDRERADDVRQSAAEFILKGKLLDKALRFARRVSKRMYSYTTYVSLDQFADEDDLSQHALIAASDPADVIDAVQLSRTAVLDGTTEAVLEVNRMSAKIAAKCCVRSAKYQLKQQREEYSDASARMPSLAVDVVEVLA